MSRWSRPRPPPTAIRSTSRSGRPPGRFGAGSSCFTGSRATAAGITGLGRTLAGAGFEAHFPDRRGSGANHADRGHTPSARRLLVDVAERLESLRDRGDRGPDRAGRHQLGGQARRAHRRATPRPGRRAGPDLPRPAPSRRGLAARAAPDRLGWLTDRRRTFPIPLSDPALFTASPEAQAFIAADPLGLRVGDREPARGQHDHRPDGPPGSPEGPPARPADAGRPGSDRRQRPDARLLRDARQPRAAG